MCLHIHFDAIYILRHSGVPGHQQGAMFGVIGQEVFRYTGIAVPFRAHIIQRTLKSKEGFWRDYWTHFTTLDAKGDYGEYYAAIVKHFDNRGRFQKITATEKTDGTPYPQKTGRGERP